jgi:hypothetical protein
MPAPTIFTRPAKESTSESVNEMKFARDMLSQKYPIDSDRQQMSLHENMIDPNAGIPLTDALVVSLGRRLEPADNPHFHILNRATLINTAMKANLWNPMLGDDNIFTVPSVIEIYYME